jgi:hypothetical protein
VIDFVFGVTALDAASRVYPTCGVHMIAELGLPSSGGIHVFHAASKTWMAGLKPGHDETAIQCQRKIL